MTALATTKQRIFGEGIPPLFRHYKVKTGVTIYKGAGLTHDSGYVRPLASADTVFVGIAEETIVAGSAASGTYQVLVRVEGEELVASVGTYTIANIGSAVYALDDSLPYSHDNTNSATVGELGAYDGTHYHVIFRGVNAA
jgi:hypothetical protein